MTMHTVLDIALMGAVIITAWYAKTLRGFVATLAMRIMTLGNDHLKDRAAFIREIDRLRRETDILREKCRKLDRQVFVMPQDAWKEAEADIARDELGKVADEALADVRAKVAARKGTEGEG